MNDFSELEEELRKLRPRAASPELVTRIERALGRDAVESPASSAPPTALRPRVPSASTAGVLPRRRAFRLNWFGLGLGVAAAAAFLLLARVNVERTPSETKSVAAVTPSTSEIMGTSLVPVGLTQVVYNRRDEGLLFNKGADQPVRRLRSRQRETLQWRNPGTGASLRVSYPSEEVTLIPATGQ